MSILQVTLKFLAMERQQGFLNKKTRLGGQEQPTLFIIKCTSCYQVATLQNPTRLRNESESLLVPTINTLI